jgi:hypothetical protein
MMEGCSIPPPVTDNTGEICSQPLEQGPSPGMHASYPWANTLCDKGWVLASDFE